MVQEKAFAYLNALATDELRSQLEAIRVADNLQPIAEVIKAAVVADLLEEYGSIYPEGENDKKVVRLFSQIVHINLTPVNLATLTHKLNRVEASVTATTMGLFATAVSAAPVTNTDLRIDGISV